MSAAIPGICYGKLRANLKRSDIILFIIVVIVTIMGFSGAILSVLDPS